MRFTVLWLCMLWLYPGLIGQVTFDASADADEIIEGSYFTVSFTLKNGKAESFTAPEFKEVDVISGPSTSSQVMIVNGQMSQTVTYSYVVTPERVGTCVIEPATVIVNGTRYKSKQVVVRVVKRDPNQSTTSSATGDIYVETVLSSEIGHIGQQILLKYVLYTNKSVGSYHFQQIPEFDGFYYRHLAEYRERPKKVVKDGREYTTQAIRAYALFPQQKGNYIIPSIPIQLGIKQNGNRGGFFFNSQLKPILVKSDPVEIVVTDLETDSIAPVSYADAIGDFYLGTAIDKKRLPKDDALTLTYQIRGDGDGKIFKAPDQSYTDHFDIYEPNLLREDADLIDDRIVTTKTYEYLMIPKREGEITFRPELSYYSPDSQRYMTILGETYTISVTPPTGRQRKDIAAQIEEWPEPYTLGSESHSTSQTLWGSTLHTGLLGAWGVGLLGLLGFYRKKIKENAIDPAFKRNAAAKKVAIAQLTEAKKALSAGDHKEFYVQLRKGLLEYLSSKTYQDSSQMSKDDIIALLQKNNLSAYESDIIDVMKKGEMAIYANMSSGDEQQMYDKIISIIENIETSLEK